MHKRFVITVAGLTLGAAALLAQGAGTPGVGQGFQAAGTLMPAPTRAISAIAGRVVTGSPFSAVEESKTTQTLGDGTLIERTDTSTIYRDTEGRTRVEQTRNGHTMITIVDPVAQTRVMLDPTAKTARVLAAPGQPALKPAVPIPSATADRAKIEAEFAAGMAAAGRGRGAATTTAVPAGGGVGGAAATTDMAKMMAEFNAQRETNAHTNSEDLGVQHHNGVQAQGTRTTLTIPVGQIGNNREIKVVNERWFSQDLQMDVKTLNSDPRYGTTTYELKNISRNSPDAMLFQIPADYTRMEGTTGLRGAVKKQ
jgi:hypothetical protein